MNTTGQSSIGVRLEDRPTAWLVPLSGPPMGVIELLPVQGGMVLGRHEQCDILVPAKVDKVSRSHARFHFDGGHWRVTDMRSRWGTYINGFKAGPEQDVILSDGDLIRISPFTFTFSSSKPQSRGVESNNDADTHETLVRTISLDGAGPAALANDLLGLLLEFAAGVQAQDSETALAEFTLDAAVRGTGLANAALLRPVDAAGRVEIIAQRSTANVTAYSRALLARAATGVVAEFRGQEDVSVSIVQMQVQAAICVPLMLGSTVAAFLYLDSRGAAAGAAPARLRPNAASFCLALGRIVSLALANLKRLEIERRQAALEAELTAGAEAQRWIFPPRQGKHGPFIYIGESRAGRYVGGDFFDVIPVDENRIAVALGDVAGKGIPASVLMTATQGFLHAALSQGFRPDALARAVNQLNAFVCPRCPAQKFVTLWAGLFNLSAQTLTYIDAGHGYAFLIKPDGSAQTLAGDGLPIGVSTDTPYTPEVVALPRGAAALVVSDGIIEQPQAAAPGISRRRQFDVEGVQACMLGHHASSDVPAALFAALVAHAGSEQLADDATAVHIRW
jgi:serine phosphatase RsbU (regulator of sigma subunit)